MRSATLSALRCASMFYLLTSALACGDQAPVSPGPPSPELEGPRGQVTSPGPWVVRAYLPSAEPPVDLAIELSTEGGEWEPSPPLPLNPSARPELWLAALPALEPERALRYRLSTREESAGGPYAWRQLSLAARDEVSDEPVTCRVTLLDPQAEQVLQEGDDVGQASGIQYRFVAQLTSSEPQDETPSDALTHAVKLSVNLDTNLEQSVMGTTEGGLIALPLVTIAQGAQRAQLEGYTAQGAHCTQTFTTRAE